MWSCMMASILCMFFLNKSFPDLKHILISINNFMWYRYLFFWVFFFFYLSKNIYIIYQVILKWWKRMSRCKSARKNWNCAEWIQIWIGKGRPLILSEKKYIILVKIAMFTKIIHKKLLKMIIIICLRWVLLLELLFFSCLKWIWWKHFLMIRRTPRSTPDIMIVNHLSNTN